MRTRVLSFVLVALLSSATAHADITVGAAASLAEVMQGVGEVFERKMNTKVSFHLAGSNSIMRQIENGAPIDVFVSADELHVRQLAQKHLLGKTEPRTIASNELVIVVPVDAPATVRKPSDLATRHVEKIALADPATVPAGIYAKAYLTRAGLWRSVAGKVVPTLNVRAALAAVAGANVDAAIVYRTDARASKDVRIACTIPRAEAPLIRYVAALTKQGQQSAEARQFLVFLTSAAAHEIFAQYGFLPAP
jgi:molybdate transport system substrate-binding protein